MRELALAIQLANLRHWRDMLLELTPSQLELLRAECLSTIDAVRELELRRQGPTH